MPIDGQAKASAEVAMPMSRQFNFWESQEVKDADDLALGPAALRSLAPPYVLTAPSPSSPLATTITCIISTSDGYISLLDRLFRPVKRWKAWAGGNGSAVTNGSATASASSAEGKERAALLLERGGVLLGIAEDDHPTGFPLLKIWDLTHDDRRNRGRPVLLRTVRLGTGSRGYPVTCVAGSTNLSYFAVGLVSGQVLLYRHVGQSLASSPHSMTSFPKPRTAWEGSLAEPISGLSFGETTPVEGVSASTSLFVVTPNKTIVIPSVTGKGTEPRVLDEQAGGGLGACDGLPDGSLLIGRDDGIASYGSDKRGEFIAFEGGSKSLVHVHGRNVAFVSPPFAKQPNGSGGGATAAAGGLPGSPNAAKLTVFDLSNKFVAYSSVFKKGVEKIFSTGRDDLHVITGDGKLWRLSEQPTTAKLDTLYRRNLYTLAIEVARSADVDPSDIYAKYGDYLYNKGDFEGAMSQYVKTLGSLQPSHVIRKYLDAQRIHFLITYLQELHGAGLASPDHTTLLLNCYTKTNDDKRLEKFLIQETRKTENDVDLPFELDTAIRVCRQGGFFDNALYLARRYQRHQEYLQIQLEDRRDFQDAIAYLRGLSPAIAQQNLLRYGKTMLDDQTDGTTDLLVDLCSGTFFEARVKAAEARAQAAAAAAANGSGTTPSTNYFSYIGYDAITGVFGGQGDKAVLPPNEAEKAAPPPPLPTYDAPAAQPFFALFIDHPLSFVRFLESVARIRWHQELASSTTRTKSHRQSQTLDPSPELDNAAMQQRSIWNTLFELYLTSTDNRAKALSLLEQADRLPVDPMHALVLCYMHRFTEGQILLWEKLGMFEDILRHFMQQSDGDDAVLRHLHMYGPTNLHLYPMVLRYLSSSSDLLSRHVEDVKEILGVIDEENIMPPLAVVQLLGRNSVATIGLVKEWLQNRVAETRQDLDSNRALVTSYRSETADKLQDIANLSSLDKPQVFQVTRCALCGGQLDLPAVHFMCKHSYHQRCLPDADPECPSCARQYAVIREMRRNQEALSDRHDLFLTEVAEAEDGFGVIAGAFGRGLLNKQPSTMTTTTS